MSEEKATLTQFQLGVMAALQVVGTSLAALDPSKRTQIDEAIQKLMAAIPEDKGFSDGSSQGHLALRALRQGLLIEPKKQ